MTSQTQIHMEGVGTDVVVVRIMGMAVEIGTRQKDTEILANINFRHRIDDQQA